MSESRTRIAATISRLRIAMVVHCINPSLYVVPKRVLRELEVPRRLLATTVEFYQTIAPDATTRTSEFIKGKNLPDVRSSQGMVARTLMPSMPTKTWRLLPLHSINCMREGGFFHPAAASAADATSGTNGASTCAAALAASFPSDIVSESSNPKTLALSWNLNEFAHQLFNSSSVSQHTNFCALCNDRGLLQSSKWFLRPLHETPKPSTLAFGFEQILTPDLQFF